MNTFIRYFLYFFSIPFILFMVLFVLIILDNKFNPNNKALLLFFVSVFVYAIPVSLIVSSREELEIVQVDNDVQGKNMEIINNIIKTATKRTEYIKSGNQTVYYMKNRFYKWLTNEVSINETKDTITVSIPRAHTKLLKEKLGLDN